MASIVKHGSQQLLVSTFLIQDTLFGIDTMKVQEVIRIGDVTPVHHAPEYIVGIINLRGRIVTILDLGRKLELFKLEIKPDSRIIIVEWQGEYVGFLVDGVSDVVDVERDKLGPPPSNVKGAQGRFFDGVYQSEGRRLISILNIESVLSEKES